MAKTVHLFHQLQANRKNRVAMEVAYEIEQFLYTEAELLDSWRFQDWLALMAPDIHYWAPVRENRLAREMDEELYPPGTSAHFDETRQMLAERVTRLYTNMAWAEMPPSRTRHQVTNIRGHRTEKSDEFEVESSFHVYRTSGERHQDYVVGKRFDLLRRDENPHGFLIARRTLVFDMSTLLVKNLSLFY